MFFLRRDLFDDGIGKVRPADARMAHGLIGPHGEGCVEQHDTLFRPVRKIAVVRDGQTEIVPQLLEDIDQRRGRGNTFLNGKAEPMRLTGTMIGVLTQQYDLEIIKRGGFKSVEDQAAGWIDGPAGLFFRFEMRGDLEEVGFLKLVLEHFLPGVFDFYFLA